MKLRSAALIVSAAMLFMLPGCSKKKVMPEKFKTMPDAISADEIEIPHNEPVYKRTEKEYVDGELKSVTESEYDEHDHIITDKWQRVDEDGLKTLRASAVARQYDDNNNPVLIVDYVPESGHISTLTKQTYTPENDNDTIVVYTAGVDSDVLKKWYYFESKYDGDHNKTADIYASAKDGIKDDLTYKYEYDSSGNIIKKTEKNKLRKDYLAEYSYTYDSNGNMLSEIRHARTSKDDSTRETTYEYDSRGNCIKKTNILDGGRPDVETYEYDSKDRIIHKTHDYYEYEYEYEDY